MKKIILGLDCGHGNKTFSNTGAKGVWYFDDNGVKQKFEEHGNFNAPTVLKAKKLAELNGFEVVLTQTPFGDVDTSLSKRVNIARTADVDLLFSFHADAGNPKARGHWCFFWQGHEPSGKLALLWDKNADRLMNETLDRNYRESVKDTWTEFHMCREPIKYGIPSILIEHAYFTNPEDRKLLMSDSFQDDCAEVAIRTACDYFGRTFIDKEIKNVESEEGDSVVQVDKIRVASGTGKRIDGDHSIKGSDVRVIKINPEEYDIKFVVAKGKTVEQISVSENADFAINAPYFSGNQIIGYSKNEDGLISYDAAGSKTNSWYGFAMKDGVPFIGAVYGKDVVDFAFKSSPFLVNDGENVANERVVVEQTAPDIKDAPKPRTALFLDENNHIIVTVVDGWTKKNLYKYDRGLYLDELADMGIGLGAKKGLNLDGGGSVSLYIKGLGLVNALQDGVSRVTGHALVFKKKAAVKPVAVAPVEDKLPLIQRTVKVIVNGKETESTGYLINDSTYLPIREITDRLGGKIDNWDALTYTVMISKK